MILHAMGKWPEGMDAALWPYAMRLTCNIDNCTYRKRMHITPLEGFSNVQVHPKIRNYHPFGCPAYVLTNHTGINTGKWNARA
jgi:hypothetical protein